MPQIDLCNIGSPCPAGHFPYCEKEQCRTYVKLRKRQKGLRKLEFNQKYAAPLGDAWRTFWRFVHLDHQATGEYEPDLQKALELKIIWEV